MPHAYTENQLVEQPALGLFAELGWGRRRTRDLLLLHLLSGQVNLKANSTNAVMTFRNQGLRDFAVPMSTNWLLNDLAEAKGKQELYTRQSP